MITCRAVMQPLLLFLTFATVLAFGADSGEKGNVERAHAPIDGVVTLVYSPSAQERGDVHLDTTTACVGFRPVSGCDAYNPPLTASTLACDLDIQPGRAGYCVCALRNSPAPFDLGPRFHAHHVDCGHLPFRCKDICKRPPRRQCRGFSLMDTCESLAPGMADPTWGEEALSRRYQRRRLRALPRFTSPAGTRCKNATAAVGVATRRRLAARSPQSAARPKKNRRRARRDAARRSGGWSFLTSQATQCRPEVEASSSSSSSSSSSLAIMPACWRWRPLRGRACGETIPAKEAGYCECGAGALLRPVAVGSAGGVGR